LVNLLFNSSQNKTCYECDSPDHLVRDCPIRAQRNAQRIPFSQDRSRKYFRSTSGNFYRYPSKSPSRFSYQNEQSRRHSAVPQYPPMVPAQYPQYMAPQYAPAPAHYPAQYPAPLPPQSYPSSTQQPPSGASMVAHPPSENK
jgi:hypothetical protein